MNSQSTVKCYDGKLQCNLLRIKLIVESCCLSNPYLYGFAMMMPLFFDKSIVNSDATIPSNVTARKCSRNLLRQVMKSPEYTSTLRRATINHGMKLTPSSKLMFDRARYGVEQIVDMKGEDLQHLFDQQTGQYVDLFGKIHDILLPR